MNLNKAFQYTIGGNGIFHYLSSLNVPWTESATVLDSDYHGNRSGHKTVSPLIDICCDNNTDGLLSESDKVRLATVLMAKFGVNWTKLYNTLSFTYNPIENYRMTEIESVSGQNDTTSQDSGTESKVNTGTQTTGENIDETMTDTGTQGTVTSSETVSNIAGFNSPTYVNDNQTTGSGSGTRTDNLTHTHDASNTYARTDDLSEIQTFGKRNVSEESTQTDRELTRSGNIGVTTSQQMIESERDLWLWNFFEQVFKDIDKTLTCPVYGESVAYNNESSSGNISNQILNKLNEIQSGIDDIEEAVSDLDFSEIETEISNSEGRIKTEITNSKNAITTAISNSETAIKNNDNTNTSTIRGDILTTVTQGY